VEKIQRTPSVHQRTGAEHSRLMNCLYILLLHFFPACSEMELEQTPKVHLASAYGRRVLLLSFRPPVNHRCLVMCPALGEQPVDSHPWSEPSLHASSIFSFPFILCQHPLVLQLKTPKCRTEFTRSFLEKRGKSLFLFITTASPQHLTPGLTRLPPGTEPPSPSPTSINAA
jgi:hypothetical protein